MNDYKILHGLPPETLQRMEEMMYLRKYKHGDIVCAEGEAAKEMYFIGKGIVEVIVKGQKIKSLIAGETFGEMSLVDMMTRSATVMAEGDTDIYILEAKSLYELYKTDIKGYAMIILNIARELSRRLREMDEKAAEKLNV